MFLHFLMTHPALAGVSSILLSEQAFLTFSKNIDTDLLLRCISPTGGDEPASPLHQQHCQLWQLVQTNSSSLTPERFHPRSIRQ